MPVVVLWGCIDGPWVQLTWGDITCILLQLCTELLLGGWVESAGNLGSISLITRDQAGWLDCNCRCLFWLVVPKLQALRLFSTCSLLLSLIYTRIAIGVAFSDGMSLPTLSFMYCLYESFCSSFVTFLQLNLSVKWIHMILKKPKNFPLRVYNLNQRKKS